MVECNVARAPKLLILTAWLNGLTAPSANLTNLTFTTLNADSFYKPSALLKLLYG